MWLASWSSRETDVSFPGALDLHVGALGCCSYNEKFPANADLVPDCTNFQQTLGKSSHECLEQPCKASEKANNIHEVCESLAEDEDVRASLPATAPGSQRRPDRCFQEQGLGVSGSFRAQHSQHGSCKQ